VTQTLELAKSLIRAPSVTPDDAGCQELMIHRLARMGFTVERLPFGEVSNFWARRGTASPLLAFAGHTDVVPPGPSDQWDSDPFTPEIRKGYLYGRGAADMKGSLAAMLVACERFLSDHPAHAGSIAFLITSDEEGAAADGTRRVMEALGARGEHLDWCLVGEPSSSQRVADTVKNGRRGSLHGRLMFRGVQGHVAYPHLAENPIHGIGRLIAELTDESWDHGNEFFPPTSFQISNIWSGTGATNVIPGELELLFNFRYSTESTAESLQARVERMVEQHVLNEEVRAQRKYPYDIVWHLSGRPFLTRGGELVDAVQEAVHSVTGRAPVLSTAGGTSDGRFIAPTGTQVVELGPVNETIHKVNECVRVQDLDRLTEIYQSVLRHLLVT